MGPTPEGSLKARYGWRQRQLLLVGFLLGLTVSIAACSSDDPQEVAVIVPEETQTPPEAVPANDDGDDEKGWFESIFGGIEPGPTRGTYQPPGDGEDAQQADEGLPTGNVAIRRSANDPASDSDGSDFDEGWLPDSLEIFGGDETDEIRAPAGFSGWIVADEPRAALVAKEILNAGGTAADAAVGLYMALSVTYPAAASLGGGGVCLSHDQRLKRTQALEFLPLAPETIPANATRPSAIPGSVRGMAALHARQGRLAWAKLVRPAEQLARSGTPVSRMLADDLVLVSHALLDDPAARRIFADSSGTPLMEGDQLRQFDLAVALTRLRLRGPRDFYDGQVAETLAKGAEKAGGTIERIDLRQYRAKWSSPVSVQVGGLTFVTVPPPALGGLTALDIVALINGRFDAAGVAERPHLFAEAAMRAFSDRQLWKSAGSDPAGIASSFKPGRLAAAMASYNPSAHTRADSLATPPKPEFENPAATSFATMDLAGNAVICTVTTYNLFGTGRVADGTGIVLAAAPLRAGLGPTPLGPVMALRADQASDLVFAGASTGGAAAPTALAWTMLHVLSAAQPLERAMAMPRVHHGGVPDRVLVEAGGQANFVAALERRGHQLEQIDDLGLVNAMACPSGFVTSPERCTATSDPRGHGVAINATQ